MNDIVLFLANHKLPVILALLALISLLSYLTYLILKNPFKYPYFEHEFDVSRKRNIHVEDYIDRFLCDANSWRSLQIHERYITEWKIETEEYIQNCILKEYRTRQYLDILDDDGAYRFKAVRGQTRYRQRNYVKTSYTVSVFDSGLAVNWSWLVERHDQLAQIGFEATLNEYHSKSQRKLMTKPLRIQIMERDRYTCQICGKYMPDEVGLHIDHIIPIAKGGKSVPSNLRVLCSKCNGRKGAK